MSDTITITANGKPYRIAPAQRLDEFLASVGLQPRQVIVERNGTALTPGEAREATLSANDVLEIVRIVAGG